MLKTLLLHHNVCLALGVHSHDRHYGPRPDLFIPAPVISPLLLQLGATPVPYYCAGDACARGVHYHAAPGAPVAPDPHQQRQPAQGQLCCRREQTGSFCGDADDGRLRRGPPPGLRDPSAAA